MKPQIIRVHIEQIECESRPYLFQLSLRVLPISHNQAIGLEMTR